MSATDLISRIERLDYEYRTLVFDDSERGLVDIESYEKFRQSLYDILEKRKQSLYEKSKELSDRMSYGHDNFTLKNATKFNKLVLFDEDIENILMSKINQVIGLDMPVLELFPGNGQFTSKLISAEPLYIADYFQETLDEVGSRFNEFYDNRRLMKLKIDDFELPLPDNQMGLVISFKFFFVKDLEFVTDWAREVFRILKPSGFFIFNFIPDNTSQGIRMVEKHTLSMINFQKLISSLEEIGYEISRFDIQNGYGSSITACKPGDLNNIKISSSLARIIDKSEPLV